MRSFLVAVYQRFRLHSATVLLMFQVYVVGLGVDLDLENMRQRANTWHLLLVVLSFVIMQPQWSVYVK